MSHLKKLAQPLSFLLASLSLRRLEPRRPLKYCAALSVPGILLLVSYRLPPVLRKSYLASRCSIPCALSLC